MNILDNVEAKAVFEVEESKSSTSQLIQNCKRFYRIYIAILILTTFVGVVVYVFIPREYTAVAVLGPVTSSSPSSDSLGAAVMALGTRVSGGADAQQIFTDYSQILTSTRLSNALISKYGFLHLAFADQWDSNEKRWRIGLSRSVKNLIASLNGGYQKNAPDADDLNLFFSKHLFVEQVQPVTASSILSSSTILSVSIKSYDPYVAEAMLKDILNEADYILRMDEKRNVDARIAHLQAMLPMLTVTDQREALTSVLTNQMEVQTLVQSDKRYASVLLDPPHASLVPTFPSLALTLILVVVLTLATGTALIFFLPDSNPVLRAFDTRR